VCYFLLHDWVLFYLCPLVFRIFLPYLSSIPLCFAVLLVLSHILSSALSTSLHCLCC
jgi:hypothetical protein